jgi:ABC-type transport system involved in multi-copper enzyme maturation permease subunit
MRCLAAALACGISGFFLLIFALDPSSSAIGAEMFSILSGYTLILSLLGGIFLAADCLSEERREGTLGFLFLTDLKGYDIVLGKFVAVSLNAFYALLAIFPVLGLCLLAGGVSGQEFWRMCLVLANSLFFSVTAALWVSSRCQQASRALANSIGLLVVVLVLAILAWEIRPVSGKFAPFLYYAGALSPLSPFSRAAAAGYYHQSRDFWISLGLSHLVGWMFLGLASWRLKFFRQAADCPRGWKSLLTRDLVAGKCVRRSRNLELNPVLWLLDDSRRLRWIVWGLVVACACILIITVTRWRQPELVLMISVLAWPFFFLIKVLFAIQACRFFGEARRTAALELLCSTPLTQREMIRGQWMALARVFLWPVVFLLVVQFGCCICSALGFLGKAYETNPANFYFYFLAAKQFLNNAGDFAALGWFGMWAAISFRKPQMASGATILYILILPLILFCIPTLATDTVFAVLGLVKLRREFTFHLPFQVYVSGK